MPKKYLYLLPVIFLFASCIPYSIAPKLKDDRIQVAKRFKRKLPKTHAFIFRDTREANAFYDFVYNKFDPNPEYFNVNIPIQIDQNLYYLSFYEVEKKTSTLNFVPIFIDMIFQSKEMDPVLEEQYTSRAGSWYFAITLRDELLQDSLDPEYEEQQELINYLKMLKKEYLAVAEHNNQMWTKH
ncbi:MAG: hypothetical protein WBG71_08425 [Leeuwenhoekiella sp.]